MPIVNKQKLKELPLVFSKKTGRQSERMLTIDPLDCKLGQVLANTCSRAQGGKPSCSHDQLPIFYYLQDR